MRRIKSIALALPVVCFLLITFISTASAQVHAPSSSAAIQAYVFDGAFDVSSLYAVSYTDAGVLSYIPDIFPDLPCPNGPAGDTGVVVSSPDKVAVFKVAGPALGFNPQLDPAGPPIVPIPVFNLALVIDDCVALENQDSVATYIAAQINSLDNLATEFLSCQAEISEMACAVHDTVESIKNLCDEWFNLIKGELLCPDLVGGPDTNDLPISSEECRDCYHALNDLPNRHVEVQLLLNDCYNVKNNLQLALAVAQKVLDEVVANETCDVPDFEYATGCLADEVDGFLAQTEVAKTRLEQTLAVVTNQLEACNEFQLEASCEECSDVNLDPDPLTSSLTGAIRISNSTSNLGRLQGAFESASHNTDDPTLAQTYSNLAKRISNMGGEKVLNMWAPSDLPFSQQFVALAQDDTGPYDAVIITMVRQHGLQPTLSRADWLLFQEVLETFANTLARTSPPPSDSPR